MSSVFAFTALDRQNVVLHLDVELVRLEAGDDELDSVVVLTDQFDVIRRVAWAAVSGGGVQHFGQSVEADGGTIKGGKIDRHCILLKKQGC